MEAMIKKKERGPGTSYPADDQPETPT